MRKAFAVSYLQSLVIDSRFIRQPLEFAVTAFIQTGMLFVLVQSLVVLLVMISPIEISLILPVLRGFFWFSQTYFDVVL